MAPSWFQRTCPCVSRDAGNLDDQKVVLQRPPAADMCVPLECLDRREKDLKTSEVLTFLDKSPLRRVDSAPAIMMTVPPVDELPKPRRRARTSKVGTMLSKDLPSKEELRRVWSLSDGRGPEEDLVSKPSTDEAAEELPVKLDEMKGETGRAESTKDRAVLSNESHRESLPEAEGWPEYLARCTRCIEAAGVSATAAGLFEAFRTSDDLSLIFATFAKMFEFAVSPTPQTGRRGSGDFSAPPWAALGETPGRRWRYPYEVMRLCVGGWKAKGLWSLLDKRCSRKEYLGRPCEMQHAVVVGAGPCGLRAAIELRLLGASVTVVERRKHISRINQLHVWSWVGEDLISLGARILQPPPSDFGSNPDLLHISISDVQKLLLKFALLLGVEVLFGVDFVRSNCSSDGWSAILGPSFSAGGYAGEGKAGPETPESFFHQLALVEAPSPRPRAVLDGMTVLIGANGFGSAIGQGAGIRRLGTDLSRSATAIGIICNLSRTHGRAERKLRSFSFARQFYMELFRKLQESTGAELENIVYVKSSLSHYFVMTPTLGCLIKTGVVIDAAYKPLLAKQNIDQACLDQFVQRVTSFPLKKGEPAVRQAILSDVGEHDDSSMQYADSGPKLFDFSQTSRAADGLVFAQPPRNSLEGQDSEECCDADDLLIALVGDALVEPFWPEGLGLIRGFFGALDATSAVAQWSGGATPGETRAHYEEAYKQLKSLSAATRKRLLHDAESAYTYLPNSRYRQFSK